MKYLLFSMLFLLSITKIIAQGISKPSLKEVEFLRTTTQSGRANIEFDLFSENTQTIEVICTEYQSKKNIILTESTITIDSTYTFEKSYRAKLLLPDVNKDYLYTFVARNEKFKSTPVTYYYQKQPPPDLILSGAIKYQIVNKDDLKVEWNLSTNLNLNSYSFNLKIKYGDFTRSIQGKLANLTDDKIFENVFQPGNTYKVSFEVGANEASTKLINGEQELKVGSEKPLDFVANSYPVIIFFNNGTRSGVKVKFQTTKPCLAKLEINKESEKNEFITKKSSTKTDNHEMDITDELNFVSSGNESIAFMKVTLTEVDEDGNPLPNKSKEAIFGIGGSKSASATRLDSERKERPSVTSQRIGEVLGTGLRGLVKAVLPIPL